jgi:hypothetical protein
VEPHVMHLCSTTRRVRRSRRRGAPITASLRCAADRRIRLAHAPGGQRHREIDAVDLAVAVGVRGAVGLRVGAGCDDEGCECCELDTMHEVPFELVAARTPGPEQGRKVRAVDDPVTVDVACDTPALAPLREHDAEVGAVHLPVDEDIGGTRRKGREGD